MSDMDAAVVTSKDRSGRSQAERRQMQLLSDLSKGLDVQHHNSSLMHEFGAAFDAPQTVAPGSSSSTGSVGTAPSPARSDHQHGAEVPTFIYPTLINGWSNYGGSWQTARYFKMGGMVHIQGLVGGGGFGVAVFHLEVGYRPIMTLLFATIHSNAIGRVNVQSDGAVFFEALGANSFCGLNCSFYPGA